MPKVSPETVAQDALGNFKDRVSEPLAVFAKINIVIAVICPIIYLLVVPFSAMHLILAVAALIGGVTYGLVALAIAAIVRHVSAGISLQLAPEQRVAHFKVESEWRAEEG